MITATKSRTHVLAHISRKELIRYTVIALISVIGVAAILQATAGNATLDTVNTSASPSTSVYSN